MKPLQPQRTRTFHSWELVMDHQLPQFLGESHCIYKAGWPLISSNVVHRICLRALHPTDCTPNKFIEYELCGCSHRFTYSFDCATMVIMGTIALHRSDQDLSKHHWTTDKYLGGHEETHRGIANWVHVKPALNLDSLNKDMSISGGYCPQANLDCWGNCHSTISRYVILSFFTWPI